MIHLRIKRKLYIIFLKPIFRAINILGNVGNFGNVIWQLRMFNPKFNTHFVCVFIILIILNILIIFYNIL